MRLRERHEHPGVVSRPQNLREAQVRAGLAIVVVRINEVDPDALEALQTFPRTVVARERGAHLRVVQRHGAQENATAVQIEVAAIDPEFAKAESDAEGRVQDAACFLGERNGNFVQVLRRVNIPEHVRFPALDNGDASRLERRAREWFARELLHEPAILGDTGSDSVLPVHRDSLQCRVKRDLRFAHGCVHLHVGDARAGRCADEKHIAAQATPGHSASGFARGVGVGE